MVTVPNAGKHAAGILAAARRCGRPVGDNVAEDPKDLPYGVFYDLSGGSMDGPAGDADADLEFPYQITIVGETAEQVRAMYDRVAHDLADGITVEGRDVLRNAPDGGFGAVQRDDVVGKALYYATPRWRLFSTPA